MSKRYSIILLLLLPMAACKPSREELITRKWQEVQVENMQIQEALKSQQNFMDTMGTHTTPEENLANYGVTNIDSFRNVLKMNMDSFNRLQQVVIDSTRFEFKKNSVVYLHSMDGVDSANWSFEDEHTLLLDELKLKGAGTQIRMEILSLSDTALRLKFNENNASSTAIFVPAKQ